MWRERDKRLKKKKKNLALCPYRSKFGTILFTYAKSFNIWNIWCERFLVFGVGVQTPNIWHLAHLMLMLLHASSLFWYKMFLGKYFTHFTMFVLFYKIWWPIKLKQEHVKCFTLEQKGKTFYIFLSTCLSLIYYC